MNVHSVSKRRAIAQPKRTDTARLTVRISGPKSIGVLVIAVPSSLVVKIGNPGYIGVFGTMHEGLIIKPDKAGVQCRKYSMTHHQIVLGLKAIGLSKEARRMVEVQVEFKDKTIRVSGPPLEWVQARDYWCPDYEEPTEYRLPQRAEDSVMPILRNEFPAIPVSADIAHVDKPFPNLNREGPSPTAPLPKQTPQIVTPEIHCADSGIAAMLDEFNVGIEALRQLKSKIDDTLMQSMYVRTVLRRDLTGLMLIPASVQKTGGKT